MKYSKNKTPDNVSSYKDRHGSLRWRYRKKGFTAELGREFGSPDFWERLADAQKGQKLSTVIKTSVYKYGTLGWLIIEYKRSSEWKSLKESTKRAYETSLSWLMENHGHRNLKGVETRHLQKIIGDLHSTPAAANNLRKRLIALMSLAVMKGVLPYNPALETKAFKLSKEGIRPWTEDDIKQYLKHHTEGSHAHRALVVMLFTGMSRADAARFSWRHIVDGQITYKRLKTETTGGVAVTIPIHPQLRKVILETPESHETFLATNKGKQRNVDSFGNEVRKWCNQAGLPECSAHGLRKSLTNRLAEAGATTHQIAAVTGHQSLRLVEHYTRGVERKKLAQTAIALLSQDSVENPKLDEPFDMVRQKSSNKPNI